MPFRFRQFLIEDNRSTLRVGTDAMLLGSWAQPGSALKILDIGTVCGVLALMMAQQSDATVEGIDIDLPSVHEATANFSQSPWNKRLTAVHSSLGDFSMNTDNCYDFIITNPPFFSNSLRSPSSRKNNARHEDGMSIGELIATVSKLLSENGRFTVILPTQQAAQCCLLCQETGLKLLRRMIVYPKPAAPAKRIMMEFSKTGISAAAESELTILDTSGKFSNAYLTLTSSFHHF